MQVEEVLTHTEIFCNQVEYHPFLDQTDLLRLSKKHDFLLTAYCPVVRGKVKDEESIQRIARKHNKSSAQIALRWLIQQRQVAAIPKASDPDHRQE
ncbi:MAG: aldo/keto reductase, partial [Fulvivirga sp.]|nr:aldo/keto reductase [Fulvivirga sp.]